jgi:predicted aldo/keto reductase-like oxidoreductase
VFTVLPGCRSGEEVRSAIAYLDADDADKDYTPFLNESQNNFKGSCVYCNHCQPCPAGIDIATVNKYLDIARLDEAHIPPSIALHYRSLERGGLDCIACGKCEDRCPFDVPIIDNMISARTLFGEREWL